MRVRDRSVLVMSSIVAQVCALLVYAVAWWISGVLQIGYPSVSSVVLLLGGVSALSSTLCCFACMSLALMTVLGGPFEPGGVPVYAAAAFVALVAVLAPVLPLALPAFVALAYALGPGFRFMLRP